MQTKKMSLANIKGKLSRAEMKNIMAGSGGYCGGGCYGTGDWIYTSAGGVSQASCSSDIRTYCSSGAGYCSQC